MSIDEGLRDELAEYILQEKELKEKLAAINAQLQEPEEKLAKAKAILLRAKQACEDILAEIRPLISERTLLEGELEILANKKSELRKEAARDKMGIRPGTQALVEQMNQLAGDAATAELQKETKQLDAAAALAALKEKMGK